MARNDFAVLEAPTFEKDGSDFVLDAVAFEDAGNSSYEEAVSIEGLVAGYAGSESTVRAQPVALSSSRDSVSREMQLGTSRFFFLTRGMSGGPFVPSDVELNGPFPGAIAMAWLGRKPQANGTFEEARYAFLRPPDLLTELVAQSKPVQIALQKTRELKAAGAPKQAQKLNEAGEAIKVLRRTQLSALAFLLRSWPVADRVTPEGTPTISAAFFARLTDRARRIGVSYGINELLEAFELPVDPKELVRRADAQAAELSGVPSAVLLDQAEGAAFVAEPTLPALRDLAAAIAAARADVLQLHSKEVLAAEWSLTKFALTGIVSADLKVPPRVFRRDPALFGDLVQEKSKLTRLSRAEKVGLAASKFLVSAGFKGPGTTEVQLLDRQMEFVEKFRNPQPLVVGSKATPRAMLIRTPLFVATGGGCNSGAVVTSKSTCAKRPIGAAVRDKELRGIDLCRQGDESVLPSGSGCSHGSWLGRTAAELQEDAEVPLYFAKDEECGGPQLSTRTSHSKCMLQFVGYSVSSQLDQELAFRALRSADEQPVEGLATKSDGRK